MQGGGDQKYLKLLGEGVEYAKKLEGSKEWKDNGNKGCQMYKI